MAISKALKACAVCDKSFPMDELTPLAVVRPNVLREIDLEAALEIRHLHEKIDHLLMQQWQRLVEVQQVQIELLGELGQRTKPGDL